MNSEVAVAADRGNGCGRLEDMDMGRRTGQVHHGLRGISRVKLYDLIRLILGYGEALDGMEEIITQGMILPKL